MIGVKRAPCLGPQSSCGTGLSNKRGIRPTGTVRTGAPRQVRTREGTSIPKRMEEAGRPVERERDDQGAVRRADRAGSDPAALEVAARSEAACPSRRESGVAGVRRARVDDAAREDFVALVGHGFLVLLCHKM